MEEQKEKSIMPFVVIGIISVLVLGAGGYFLLKSKKSTAGNSKKGLLQSEADAIAAQISSLQKQGKQSGDDGSVQSPAATIQSLMQQLKDAGYSYVDGKAIPVSSSSNKPGLGKGDAMVIAMKIHDLTMQAIPPSNGNPGQIKVMKWAAYPKAAIDLVGQLNTAGYIFVPNQSSEGYLLEMNSPKAASAFGGQSIDSMTAQAKSYIQQQIIDGKLK